MGKSTVSQGAERVERETPVENTSQTVDVYIGVFFEGTGNHRNNAEAGKEAREKGTDTSKWKAPFNVAKSNVTMLHDIYATRTEDYMDKIYVEGVGVSEDGTDTSKIYGMGMGKGDYGVYKKVENAIDKLIVKIESDIKIPKESKVILHVDVFGFSRGAATARFFVGKLRSKRSEINNCLSTLNNSTLFKIVFDFVGLYDTVSSYGLPTNYKNNVKELQLDAVKYAKKVFQICAADEFREKFALTDINSAEDKGVQIFLPGCHTDIGGGYLSGRGEKLGEGYLKEEDKVVLEDIDPIWADRPDNYDLGYELGSLIVYGWIRTSSDKNYTFDKNTFSKKGKLTFSNNMGNKKGYYAYLTYELMRNFACDNHSRKNIFKDIDDDNKTPDSLSFIKEKALSCISINHCREEFSKNYKELTKDWLHFSSKKGLPNDPRVDNKILKREIVNG